MTTKQTTWGTATLIAVLLSVGIGNARAQSDADVAAVSAANNAFYTALSALDAAAMGKVWANETYVTSISPRSKAVMTGWAAVQDSYKSLMTDGRLPCGESKRCIEPVDTQVRVNGNVAWTVGRETSNRKLKDGTQTTGTNFVSNVFEKKDGHWLMVSHHAHIVPQ
jgi:ketosteroid isomerase-like protein